jgi:hypothetical protein
LTNLVIGFNVAKDIGDKSIKINKEHPSVMKISENNTINNELNFKHVSEEFVTKQVNKGHLQCYHFHIKLCYCLNSLFYQTKMALLLDKSQKTILSIMN